MDKIVHGNIKGIRQTVLDEMAQLYNCVCESDVFVSIDIIDAISNYTALINREILVYISRNGMVMDVRIGDDRSVGMLELRTVRNTNRLCGVRCIHTHPNSSGILSDVDLGSLSSLKLDAMAAVGVSKEGYAIDMYVAFLSGPSELNSPVMYGPLNPHRIPQETLIDEINKSDSLFFSDSFDNRELRPERAILCGLELANGFDSLNELAMLAETAGVLVVGQEKQNKKTIDKSTFFGLGKARELSLRCSALEADICIFDDELTAVQIRNLEKILGLPVIDRTVLILDIFAQRALSREGKLQVELAQLKYRLPRLAGDGQALSRQGAGVGTRGPGEKKLEIDRRRIRRRIYELEEELKEIEKQRGLRKEQRKKNRIPVVALVGYTNAGKSTLLNTLTGSDVLAENKLFATLDPVIRKATLPNGAEFLLSDTVGFINKLPHELIKAFRSTLEEVKDADLILHIMDGDSRYRDIQVQTVRDVIDSVGAANVPVIDVLNKIDICTEGNAFDQGTIGISAKTGEGIEILLHAIEKHLGNSQVMLECTVPYSRYESLQSMRRIGRIVSEDHTENGTKITILVPEEQEWQIKQLLE